MCRLIIGVKRNQTSINMKKQQWKYHWKLFNALLAYVKQILLVNYIIEHELSRPLFMDG